MKDLGVADSNVYVLSADKTTAGGERTYLDNELLDLKNKDVTKFREVLQKHRVSESEFENWFISYFGYKTAEKAKKDFDKQKSATFGNRLKDYEQDVNEWRGRARDRILSVHTRMVGTPLEFQTDADADMISSYFDKFKDLFYAAERDSEEAANGGTYQHMRDLVAALIRRRVPILTVGNRRRFGSGLRRAIQRLNNPRLVARLNRQYHNADDAEILAMIIMAQNESSNVMFYHDADPFADKRTRMKRLSEAVAGAEAGREAVRDAISPAANKFLRFGEGAVK